MTREEAKELLPIIQAFAEGKTIQVWANDTWKDEDYPFFGPLCQYRIKPEPQYRPFKTQEECWKEMLKHQPFGWVKESEILSLHLINSITNMSIVIDENTLTFQEAMNNYEFNDGTPFGIKE